MAPHDIMKEAAENYSVYSNELKALADKIAVQNNELFSQATWCGAAMHQYSAMAGETVNTLRNISRNLSMLEEIIKTTNSAYNEAEASDLNLKHSRFDR